MPKSTLPIPSAGCGFIYALYDPRSKSLPRYIGKTRQPIKDRLKGHRCWVKNYPNHPLSVWWNKTTSEGREIAFSIIEECPKESLSVREESWIRFFKPLGSLTNISYGNGSKGLKLGRPCEENIRKTIERNKRGLSEESRRKISEANRGRKMTASQKVAFLSNPSQIQNRKQLPFFNEERKKRVVGDDGTEFESIAEATRKLDVDRFQFSTALKNNWRCRGVRWKISTEEKV